MIIGELVVNPLEVVYGIRTWDGRIPFYEVTIQLKTDLGIMSLSQRDVSDKVTKGWMKQIEKCIEERKEAILAGVFDDGDWSEEEIQ